MLLIYALSIKLLQLKIITFSGPLGQFYEQGPDGKLHRVSPDIQRQLLDLVEEQKQDVEKQQQSTTGKKATIDPYQKRPTQVCVLEWVRSSHVELWKIQIFNN